MKFTTFGPLGTIHYCPYPGKIHPTPMHATSQKSSTKPQGRAPTFVPPSTNICKHILPLLWNHSQTQLLELRLSYRTTAGRSEVFA